MLQWERLINSNIHVLNAIESTNTYALNLIKDGKAQHGALIWTCQQTAGRGQRSNEWHSEIGKDLALSLVIKHSGSDAAGMPLLNMAVSLAVRHFLAAQCGENFQVKWANDIYYLDKKIAGLLIENSWHGAQWQYSVIGIGINVNSTRKHSALSAISMYEISRQEFVLDNLISELFKNLNFYLELVKNDGGAILADYNLHLYKRNKTVPFFHEGLLKNWTIKEVLANGEISILDEGAIRNFAYGAVKQVIA
jgi:BirA family transcriptional regulator, biotin operon repressor / biotin---[acetyl-CoA-carboxylase] ligase